MYVFCGTLNVAARRSPSPAALVETAPAPRGQRPARTRKRLVFPEPFGPVTSRFRPTRTSTVNSRARSAPFGVTMSARSKRMQGAGPQWAARVDAALRSRPGGPGGTARPVWPSTVSSRAATRWNPPFSSDSRRCSPRISPKATKLLVTTVARYRMSLTMRPCSSVVEKSFG